MLNNFKENVEMIIVITKIDDTEESFDDAMLLYHDEGKELCYILDKILGGVKINECDIRKIEIY